MAGFPPHLVQALDRQLHRLIGRRHVRQAIVGVEQGDEAVGWAGAAGGQTPDGTPVTAATPFFLASIDKLLTATVVLRLEEVGRLDLDSRLSSCLPATLSRGLHRLDGTDYSERITVRHLLGHTSGLADWLEDRPRGGRSLIERITSDGDLVLETEDIVEVVRGLTPHFPPQDLHSHRPKARYCDTNYLLLMAVIEHVTGAPLHEVYEQRLFRPLDLRHTWFAGRTRPLDPTPEPPRLRVAGRPLEVPRLLRSVQGIYSTVGDTIGFLRGLVRGRLFDHAGTLTRMQEPWNRFGFPLDRAALRAPGWPIEYGLGMMRFRLPKPFAPFHAVPAVVGHTGSTGCWLFYCPRWDLFLSGSVDEVTAGAVPYRTVPRILRILGPWCRDRGR